MRAFWSLLLVSLAPHLSNGLKKDREGISISGNYTLSPSSCSCVTCSRRPNEILSSDVCNILKECNIRLGCTCCPKNVDNRQVVDINGMYLDERHVEGTDYNPMTFEDSTREEEIDNWCVSIPEEAMRQAGGQTSGSLTVAVVAYKNISQFREDGLVAAGMIEDDPEMEMFCRQNTAFDEQNRTLFENLVIGVVLGNSTISNLTNTVNITFSHKAGTKGNRTCSFWVPMENGRGQWNTSGCVTISGDNQTVCQCQHLTFFALLLQVPGTSSVLNQVALVALTYISLIGCGVSAVFSVLSITIYFVYKQARRDQTGTIHVCLSASLLLLYLLFLVNEKLASLGSGALCALAGGVMHYALLSSLNWMAIETLHLYLLVIRVFNSYFRRYVLKLCLFGWGSPLLVVTIVGSLNQYGRLEVKTAGNQTYGHFCWLKTEELRGVYLLNLAYLALLFLCSLAVLTAVAHRVWAMRCSQPSGGSGRHGCRDTCTVLGLSLLLGSSWGFTFMGYGPVALPGLICFSVVNSLQGFFIFLLFSLTILKARKELASEMVLCSSEHPATSQDRAGRA